MSIDDFTPEQREFINRRAEILADYIIKQSFILATAIQTTAIHKAEETDDGDSWKDGYE